MKQEKKHDYQQLDLFQKESQEEAPPHVSKPCKMCKKQELCESSFYCASCYSLVREKKRLCSKCKEQESGPNGSYCRTCMNIYRRERHVRGIGKLSEDSKRDINYRQNYGISLAQYKDMLADQHAVCAACGYPETRIEHQSKKLGNLRVDHCHKTGRVRGLLCSTCNSALGMLKEDPERIQGLLNYVQNHCRNK